MFFEKREVIDHASTSSSGNDSFTTIEDQRCIDQPFLNEDEQLQLIMWNAIYQEYCANVYVSQLVAIHADAAAHLLTDESRKDTSPEIPLHFLHSIGKDAKAINNLAAAVAL